MFCHFLDHKWQSQDPRLLWWDNGQEAKPFKIHVRFCIWILKNQMERNVVAGDIRICKQSVQTCKGFELMAAPCEVPPCWDWQKAMVAEAGKRTPLTESIMALTLLCILFTSLTPHNMESTLGWGYHQLHFLGFISTTLQTTIEVTRFDVFHCPLARSPWWTPVCLSSLPPPHPLPTPRSSSKALYQAESHFSAIRSHFCWKCLPFLATDLHLESVSLTSRFISSISSLILTLFCWAELGWPSRSFSNTCWCTSNTDSIYLFLPLHHDLFEGWD